MANNLLIWSKRSREENRKLFAYLLEEWGEDIALKMRNQIIVSSERIRDFPEQFPIFLKKSKSDVVFYSDKPLFSLKSVKFRTNYRNLRQPPKSPKIKAFEIIVSFK